EARGAGLQAPRRQGPRGAADLRQRLDRRHPTHARGPGRAHQGARRQGLYRLQVRPIPHDPVQPGGGAAGAARRRGDGRGGGAGGPDYEIAIDLHGRWNTNSALKIIRALEPYRPYFVEEAVPPENVAAMAEVQSAVGVPLATGERLFGRHGFREVLERQAVR